MPEYTQRIPQLSDRLLRLATRRRLSRAEATALRRAVRAAALAARRLRTEWERRHGAVEPEPPYDGS